MEMNSCIWSYKEFFQSSIWINSLKDKSIGTYIHLNIPVSQKLTSKYFE